METHAVIEIRENMALKRLAMVFWNSDPERVMEFHLQLEPGQRINRLRARFGECWLEANSTLDRTSPPGQLLGLLPEGGRWVRIRLTRIPAWSEFTVELETTEILAPENGVVCVETLNPSTGSLLHPLREMTVRATILSSTPLRHVFSPTHAVSVLRRSPEEAVLYYEAQGVFPEGRFRFGFTYDVPEAPLEIPPLPPPAGAEVLLAPSPVAPPADESWVQPSNHRRSSGQGPTMALPAERRRRLPVLRYPKGPR